MRPGGRTFTIPKLPGSKCAAAPAGGAGEGRAAQLSDGERFALEVIAPWRSVALVEAANAWWAGRFSNRRLYRRWRRPAPAARLSASSAIASMAASTGPEVPVQAALSLWWTANRGSFLEYAWV